MDSETRDAIREAVRAELKPIAETLAQLVMIQERMLELMLEEDPEPLDLEGNPAGREREEGEPL